MHVPGENSMSQIATIMTAQCEGMGEVGSARYEPALLPPCPSIRALCYSNCNSNLLRSTILTDFFVVAIEIGLLFFTSAITVSLDLYAT